MHIEIANSVKTLMFIDPASVSSGWSLWVNGEFHSSGTVYVSSKLSITDRLVLIYNAYRELAERFPADEVHIEQWGGRPHHYLHWSLGVITVAVKTPSNTVEQDVPVSAWMKAVEWRAHRRPLLTYLTGSEDELAAIGMGLYWFGRKNV